MDMEEREEGKLSDNGFLPMALGDTALDKPMSTEFIRDKKGRKRDKKSGSQFVGYIVVSFTLVMAFILAVAALGFAPQNSEGEAPEREDGAQDAQNVIYVQPYGGEDGALSTPEIYALCKESVVSVCVKSNKGEGIGSGFVLREDGYIATANHVIESAKEITVALSDGSEYKAELVCGESMTDLAVLKIDARGLVPCEKGDSSALATGARVAAIGTPASLDYAGSICSGEVSYARREVRIYGGDGGSLEKKMSLIQTDAPINPGNSGCPLFDGQGRVVGIVTMKLGQNFSGIGFAIPANEAYAIFESMINGNGVSEELIATVSVRAAKLGAAVQSFEGNGVYGVEITEFSSKECDAYVKLRIGDVIISVNGKAVTSASGLEREINNYAPSDAVAITVLREGQKLTFDVVLCG